MDPRGAGAARLRARLFDELDGAPVRLEQLRVVEGSGVVHAFYRVADRLPR